MVLRDIIALIINVLPYRCYIRSHVLHLLSSVHNIHVYVIYIAHDIISSAHESTAHWITFTNIMIYWQHGNINFHLIMSSTFFFLVKFNSSSWVAGPWTKIYLTYNWIKLDKILYLHHENNIFFSLSYQSADMSNSSVIQKSSCL